MDTAAVQWSKLRDCHGFQSPVITSVPYGGSNPADPRCRSVGPLQKLPAMQRLGSCVWYAWVDSCRQDGPREAAHSRAPLKKAWRGTGMQGHSRTGRLPHSPQGTSASARSACARDGG